MDATIRYIDAATLYHNTAKALRGAQFDVLDYAVGYYKNVRRGDEARYLGELVTRKASLENAKQQMQKECGP